MRRFVSVWFPHWPTDRWRRQRNDRGAAPLATADRGQGGLRLLAVDAAAAAEGLQPGMTLADARALLPALRAAPADPLADAEALASLADWSGRYTPFAAPDGADGIVLDITGCAHLFGGETALLADLDSRLRGFGLAARSAIADTPAAAWAWARYRPVGGAATAILPSGGGRDVLALLPVAGLRVPAELAAQLHRLGLRRLAELFDMPRGPLAARFGDALLRRLDRILGLAPEPISPRHPPAPWRTSIRFAEPIGERADIDAALDQLLGELCMLLERAGRGARQLTFTAYGCDGTTQRIAIGTSRPSRDRRHLQRLFVERLDGVAPGFGIEAMALDATASDPLPPQQPALAGPGAEPVALAQLVDRLQNRLGRARVHQLAPVDSHIPERAVRACPPLAVGRDIGWPIRPPRPLRLLPWPEPIEVMAPVPDDPPRLFRWRRVSHRVARAEGPERLADEWWLADADPDSRDYYRVEDSEGRRFWLFRQGPYRPDRPPRWYLHGLFA